MFAAVADTHTAIWYLFGSPRLSRVARDTIENAAGQGLSVGVSAISLAEIVYLIEKQRIAPEVLRRLMDTLTNPDEVLVEAPLDSHIVECMLKVSRAEVPDLPDRVVAATALYYEVPVITRDAKIQAANLWTVW